MHEMLSERIRRLRLARKLTQKQLAERMGASHYLTIGQWENGRRMPSSSLVSELARALGVSTDYLLHGRDGALLAALKAQIKQRAPYERLLAMVRDNV
jgi:transcriptional regulator with XRE-family HTH domain